MSLSKDLIVISNTCEEIKQCSKIQDGIKGISEVILYALDDDELKQLIKLLNKTDREDKS